MLKKCIPYCYTFFMLNLLFLPGYFFKKASSLAPNEISGLPFDLIVHIVLFAGLVISWSVSKIPLMKIYLSTIFVAAATEIFQNFVDRTPSFEDFLANVLGASIGVMISFLLAKNEVTAFSSKR